MHRRRRVSKLGVFYGLVSGGLLVGGSLWLDQRGVKVLAPVQAKTERVTLRRDPQGTWYRWYEVGVGVGNAGSIPWTSLVEVPEQRYDALRIGDSVEVRYLPQLPLFARASDRSTATVVREAMQRVGLAPLLLWVIGGLVGMWIAARIGTVAVVAGGLAWMAAGFPVLLEAPRPPAPGSATTTATVQAVTLITKSPERRASRRRRISRSDWGRRLAIPYQVVYLRLAAPGSADTVLALDAVDSGSVAALSVGAVLPVRYEPGTPRNARLADGTRRFIERNRYHFLPGIVGIPVLAMLAGIGFRRRRLRSERRAPADAAVPA
jgi:hypothetical protein